MGTHETDQDHGGEIRRFKACPADLEAVNVGFQEMPRRYECLSVHDVNGNVPDASQATLDLIDGNIVPTFSDSGAGIPTEAFAHRFDPFFAQGGKRGMGIGLSICRSIIEAHKGTQSAQNAPGDGAVCMVNLPVQPCPQGDTHARI